MAARFGTFRRLMRRLHAPIYASRVRELVSLIIPHLQERDRVLDVGCGFGGLGHAILDAPGCPADVKLVGLERHKRDGSLIHVETYDGTTMPYGDGAFDVVILADVLHHEDDPDRLMAESVRVAGRLLIIKDHKVDGWTAWLRVVVSDWAANVPYGVSCRYRYLTLRQWRSATSAHGLVTQEELTSMRLYPPVVNLLFGRGLHYLAVLRKP